MSVQMDTAAGATCFPREFGKSCKTTPATIALKSAKGDAIENDGVARIVPFHTGHLSFPSREWSAT